MVCDESTLLRIEKGQQEPKLDTLHKLSKRLNIPVNYLVNPVKESTLKYITKVKQKCREYVYHRDYLALEILLEDLEQEMFKYNIEDFKRFIDWHKAILFHKKEGNVIKAEQQLIRLLPKEQVIVSETDIGIANSLGVVYLEIEMRMKNNAGKLFDLAIREIESLPYLEDKTLFVRVGYNHALTNYYIKRFDQVISIGHKVLYFLDSHQLRYLHGRINHLLAITYEQKDDMDDAEIYMTKAAQAFLADSNLHYYTRALRALSEIQIKAGKMDQGIATLQLVQENIKKLEDPKDLPLLIMKMKREFLISC